MKINRGYIVIFLEVWFLSLVSLFGQELVKPPTQTATTNLVHFIHGGVIHFNGSYGNLNIEGWDQAEVEIIAVKSLPPGFTTKRMSEPAKQLEAVRVDAELKTNNELVISTIHPRHSAAGLEYQVHVPRDSHLVIDHGTGLVFIDNVFGDINVTCRRGDLVLMLSDAGKYSIDATTIFGVVTSDFADTPRLRRYRLGERYVMENPPSPHRIHLRVGFGGITIKAVSTEAFAPTNMK